jgi:hypothetical protein
MGTPNGIQPFFHSPTHWHDEHIVQHTCGVHYLYWFPTLQSKYTKYAFFFFLCNKTLPLGKCHFFANIAEVLQVIYALSWHFCKYTTQFMTVECQLKLSRHNSHERTWGHYLQYDRFCATLNKNWRELTFNNFTDHVKNTCCDDSRSRDFFMVWELRHPLRVLPTFEDGDVMYILKNAKFQTITVTRKLELSWKFRCHFRIQQPQNSEVQLVSFP